MKGGESFAARRRTIIHIRLQKSAAAADDKNMYYQFEPSNFMAGVPITVLSVNLSLFFLRIMKEHCIFLEAGFTPAGRDLAGRAGEMKNDLDGLLTQAVTLAGGMASPRAIALHVFVTPYTARAERLTSHFTGIPIDSEITMRENALTPGSGSAPSGSADAKVKSLMDDARRQIQKLADFKKKVLADVVNCRLFTNNYPLEIHHMLKEAELYLHLLDDLAQDKNIMDLKNLLNERTFWNENMAQHAGFTAGKLDPTEEDAIGKARMYADEFQKLASISGAAAKTDAPSREITDKSMTAAKELQDFQTDGIRGIMDCRIQSIIPPLAADHNMRETGYFMWLMQMAQAAQF